MEAGVVEVVGMAEVVDGVGVTVKGKCALGPFLSILVIECQHRCLNVNLCHGWTKCKSRAKVCF